MAVLASRVRQAAGRHGGSVLERQLFGRFDFLVGFVLPLRFQHALEVQARWHVCRGTQNTAFKLKYAPESRGTVLLPQAPRSKSPRQTQRD